MAKLMVTTVPLLRLNMKKDNLIDFLVVDPQEEHPSFVEEILLEKFSNNILVVKSALEARTVLKRKKVQFVITEFDMPSMNGIELTKLIRRIPSLFETPVLVLFDRNQKEHIPYAMEEDVDDYLLTPFSADDLLGVIDKILEGRKGRSSEQQKLKDARILLLYKKYDKAITVAQDVLTQGENNVAYLILSEAYYWQRNYDLATKYLRRLIKSRPDSKTMHLLSKVCRAENQCADAIGYLMKAISQNPFNLDLKIDLGKFYLDLDISESADRLFLEVLNSQPSDLHLIKMGKAYLRKGNIKKAGMFLDKTVRPIPETVYIFHQYALALAKQKRYQESAEQLKKCLRIVPNNMTFLLGLGKILIKMDKTNKAVKVYKHLLRLNPGHKKAQNILHYLVQQEKKPKGSEEIH